MHQAIGTGKRKSPKRFSLLTFVLIGDTEKRERERGVVVGPPMVGAAVPCRPHGVI